MAAGRLRDSLARKLVSSGCNRPTFNFRKAMLQRAQTTTRTLLEEAISERILVLDGAMGTMIHRRKLTEEQARGDRFKNHHKDLSRATDMLVLTQPRIIEEIH